MKQLLLLFSFTGFIFSADLGWSQCAFNNLDVETWTDVNNANSWFSLKDWARSGTKSITQTSDAQSGSSAVMITLNTGISVPETDFFQAVSCSEKPLSVSGYYKFTGSGSGDDSLIIFAIVSSSVITSIDDTATAVGNGGILIQADVGTYTSFSFPINYKSSAATTQVYLGAYLIRDGASAVAYLDNFSLTYPVATGNTSLTWHNGISITMDNYNEKLIVEGLKSQSELEVYNTVGLSIMKEVLSAGDFELDLAKLTSGVYVVRVETGGEYITKRIIKR